jgi:hypothetical protein
LLLQLLKLKNITINSFMDADHWGSCIAAIEQEEEEDGHKHQNDQLELIDWEGTDAPPTP